MFWGSIFWKFVIEQIITQEVMLNTWTMKSKMVQIEAILYLCLTSISIDCQCNNNNRLKVEWQRGGTHVHEQLEDALPDEQAGQRAVGHRRQPVAQHVEHVVLQESQLQVALNQLRHGALQQRHLAHGRLIALVQLAVLLGGGAHLLQQRRDQVVVVVDDVDVASPPAPAPLLPPARQHELEVAHPSGHLGALRVRRDLVVGRVVLRPDRLGAPHGTRLRDPALAAAALAVAPLALVVRIEPDGAPLLASPRRRLGP